MDWLFTAVGGLVVGGFVWLARSNRAAVDTPPPAPSTTPRLLGDVWRIVRTNSSAKDVGTKMALALGDQVTATAQRGDRALDDDSQMAIVGGRIIGARPAMSPSDEVYLLLVTVIGDSNKLTVPPPAVGITLPLSPDRVRTIGPWV